jgi:hypothetical protein
MAKYMWIRLSTEYDFKKGGEPEIVAYGGNAQGPEAELKDDLDEIQFAGTLSGKREAKAKYNTLLICHTHASPGCVWVLRNGRWVYQCS